MKLFRRTKRVNVGTYTDPIPVPPPNIEAQIEDGVLVALAAVRLAVTNRLIVRSLRDGKDYDEARLRLRVTKEMLNLAVEKEKDAKRIRQVIETVGDKPGAADGPADFRSRDAKTLKRRAKVSSGLAARLAELATDPELVGEVAERAHNAFLDEFAVSVASGAGAFTVPAASETLTLMDRTLELQGLSEDLEKLGRDRVRYPVVVLEGSNIMMFENEESLGYLEAIDVLNGEYEGFDSGGLLVELTADSSRKVRASTRADAKSQPERLVRALRRYLDAFPPDSLGADQVSAESLEELINAALPLAVERPKKGRDRRATKRAAAD